MKNVLYLVEEQRRISIKKSKNHLFDANDEIPGHAKHWYRANYSSDNKKIVESLIRS